MNSKVDRVRVSTVASERARALRQRFPSLGDIGEVHRIAALLSLKRNGYLTTRPQDIDSNPNRPARLPGAIEIYTTRPKPLLFPTVVQLVAGRSLGAEEIYEQVWYHIHLGSALLEEIAAEAESLEELYRLLMDEIPPGLTETSTEWRPRGGGGLSLQIGNKVKDNQEVYWPLNDTSMIENPHACIVGLSGQGKTQFALDLLYQIREQNPDVTFTVLDYKGDLSEPSGPARDMFETHLGCEVVVPGSSPVPVVPFQRTPVHDTEQYALGVTDLLGRLYPRLGTQQRLALRESLATLMSAPQHADGFGFKILEEYLRLYYEEKGRKEDGLTEVVSRLSVLRVFEELSSKTDPAPLITRSMLVRLNELIADSLPVAFLVISRLYDEMKRLPDVTRQGSIVNLRHVIFIDEAHHYLPLRSSPLTGIIREGRSKGVAVFLATQSVSDLAGAAGADYREFLSNAFFFKTNLSSISEIRALVPTAAQRVQQVADLIAGLEPSQMLFTRSLERDLRSSVISAAQFYRRTSR